MKSYSVYYLNSSKRIVFFERKGTSVPTFIDREEAKVQPGHPAAEKRGGGSLPNKKGRQTFGSRGNTEGDLGLDLIYNRRHRGLSPLENTVIPLLPNLPADQED
jgi:hypothetical protein